MASLPVHRSAGRPRAEEADRKQQAMIETALEEFARRGFNGASLRAIAERAEVSTRTLYNRYPDKVALFAACIEHSSARIEAVGLRLLDTLEHTLVAHAVAMIELLSNDVSIRLAMLIYREGADFPELREVARKQFEAYQVGPVIVILRSFGYQHQDLRPIAIQFVTMAYGQWQRGLIFGLPLPTPEETERHAQTVTRIFLHGIGSP
jgi:AcrR family transcriptional regulator